MAHGSLARPPDATTALTDRLWPGRGRMRRGSVPPPPATTSMQSAVLHRVPSLVHHAARHAGPTCCAAAAAAARCQPSTARPLGLKPGFSSEFALGEVLGKGGFGTVYLAARTGQGGLATPMAYAAKVLPKWRNGACQLAKITQEVKAWSTAQGGCTSVVQLLAAYEDEDKVYLVQELCRGGSLADVITSKKRFTEAECAEVCASVLEVVAACHQAHICYGDVKPANIMFSEPVQHCRRTNVKLVDFGCSQMCSQDRLLSQFSGTPRYMAPEIYLRAYGVESDMWGVGTLMYEMLCGTHPLYQRNPDGSDPTKYQWTKWLLSKPLSFDSGEWAHVSSEAIQLIQRMLDRNLKTRISAREALQHPWFAGARQTSSKPQAAAAAAAQPAAGRAQPAERARPPAPGARAPSPAFV